MAERKTSTIKKDYVTEEKIASADFKKGQVIKNYKELCSLLNIDSTKVNGSQKKILLEELERFIAYERDGNKYIITQIYKTPKEDKKKEDKRTGIYTRCIEMILTHFLAHPNENYYFRTARSDGKSSSLHDDNTNIQTQQKSGGGKFLFFRTNLYKALGLVNPNYGISFDNLVQIDQISQNEKDSGKDINSITKYSCVTEEILELFYNVTSTRIRQILERALISMEKRNIISWNYEWYISYDETIEDKDGNERVVCNIKKANADEIFDILDVRNKIMNENYNCSSMYFLAANGKMKEYVDDCDKTFFQLYRWRNVRKRIEIYASDNAALRTYNRIEREFIRECKEELNSAVYNMVIKDGENKYNRSIEKLNDYYVKLDAYEGEKSNISRNAFALWGNGEGKYKNLKNAYNAELKRVEKLSPGRKPQSYPSNYLLAAKILVDDLIRVSSVNSSDGGDGSLGVFDELLTTDTDIDIDAVVINVGGGNLGNKINQLANNEDQLPEGLFDGLLDYM